MSFECEYGLTSSIRIVRWMDWGLDQAFPPFPVGRFDHVVKAQPPSLVSSSAAMRFVPAISRASRGPRHRRTAPRMKSSLPSPPSMAPAPVPSPPRDAPLALLAAEAENARLESPPPEPWPSDRSQTETRQSSSPVPRAAVVSPAESAQHVTRSMWKCIVRVEDAGAGAARERAPAMVPLPPLSPMRSHEPRDVSAVGTGCTPPSFTVATTTCLA